MNKLKKIFLAVFFVSGILTTGHAQTDKKADLFFRDAFSCLKTKDSIKFKALFPDYKTFMQIMEKMIQSKNGTDSLTTKDQSELADMFNRESYENELSTKKIKKFFRMLSNAEKAGVEWPNAVFVSYTIDNIENLPGEIQELKGAILFTSGNSSYKMPFKNAIRYNNELYGISFRKIYKLVNDKYVDDLGNEEKK